MNWLLPTRYVQTTYLIEWTIARSLYCPGTLYESDRQFWNAANLIKDSDWEVVNNLCQQGTIRKFSWAKLCVNESC